MNEKPKHHQAPIVKINEVLKHPNADTLGIVHIEGYQVVVKLGEFEAGDFAVYIYPDSLVPQTEPFRFIWNDYVEEDGTVRESRRRVTVRKFRKEWSEGLLMAVEQFDQLFDMGVLDYKEGDDVSDVLGISHYEPQELGNTKGTNVKKRKYPKTLKGWFHYILKFYWLRDLYKRINNESIKDLGLPVYDVEAFKNHVDAFQEGEKVFVTEKIHGSNARFVYKNGKMHAGSRKLWKSKNSKCIWRKVLEQHPWIEKWCREHPDYVLYGEVVPTQKNFNYGCKNGETRLFVFDILSPEGNWLDRDELVALYTVDPYSELFNNWVPMLTGTNAEWDKEPLKSSYKVLVDGKSQVLGANHIREGIVIRPCKERHVAGLGRLQLKVVSNNFLERDGKDNEDLLS
jgi:hypothetical protein